MFKLFVSLLFLWLVVCKPKVPAVVPVDESKIKQSVVVLQIDELIDKASKETDDNSKSKLYGEASQRLIEKGDYEKAKEIAELSKQANPSQKIALTTIAEYYLYKKRFIEAEETLTDVLSREPDYARANYLMGNVCLVNKKFLDAEKYYSKAIEKDDRFMPSYINLSYILFHNGNQQKALSTAEKAIEIEPGFTEIYKNAGIIAEKMNDKAKAKLYYSKYLELSPQAKDSEVIKQWLNQL